MEKLDQYSIPFKGLKIGNYIYEFDIQDDFFTCFESDLVEGGNVLVKVTLEKQSSMMTLHFEIDGIVMQLCDRCLGEYDQLISNKIKLFVKFGEEHEELDDDVIVISPSETEINVAHLIYETIALSVPIRRVHPDDENGNSTCDPKMLEKLEEFSAPEHEEGEDETDSRWDDLKKLIGK